MALTDWRARRFTGAGAAGFVRPTQMVLTALGALLSPLIAMPAETGAIPVEAACRHVQLAEIPVTVIGSRPIVKVRIDGMTAVLLADSGASVSTLSRATAARMTLHLVPEPAGYLRGIGGDATSQVAIVKHATVANLDLDSVRFLVSSELPPKASGMLGQNILGQADTEFDLGHGVIRLIRSEGCGQHRLPVWPDAGESISTISMARDRPQESLPIATADLNGHDLRVLFDTGAPHSMLTAAGARRVGVSVDSNWSPNSVLLSGVGESTSIGSIRYFRMFKLGNEVHSHIPLYVTDIDVPRVDMVIGMDFFLSHRVYVANGQDLIYFIANERGGADRSIGRK